MSIPKFTRLTTTACPLNIENIDTDQIIPARFLKAVERKGFGDNLFRDWRFDKAGARVDGFPLNDSRYGGEILVAAKNFGCGSSREHAALDPRFLNVRAVLVKSFARIHETNLKKQGMLALTFVDPSDYDRIREDDRISITGLRSFAPGSRMTVTLLHSDGTSESFEAAHTYNEQQIGWFKAGSALNVKA